MREHARRSGVLDRPRPHVPPYLFYFGLPPFLTAFVIAAIDPMGGLAMLSCLIGMVVVLKVLPRFARRMDRSSRNFDDEGT